MPSPFDNFFKIDRRNLFTWGLILLVLMQAFTRSNPEVKTVPSIRVPAGNRALLMNGDLIFRRAVGTGSDYILSVDTLSSYSHIGIIHKNGDQITVIHASTSRDDLGARVREEDLDSFLIGVPHAAIFRIDRNYEVVANRAVEQAEQMIGKPFDINLDLRTENALYCTELVWLAYKQAGIDLLNGEFSRLNLPILGEGYYILPSNLASSSWITQIFTYHSSQ